MSSFGISGRCSCSKASELRPGAEGRLEATFLKYCEDSTDVGIVKIPLDWLEVPSIWGTSVAVGDRWLIYMLLGRDLPKIVEGDVCACAHKK